MAQVVPRGLVGGESTRLIDRGHSTGQGTSAHGTCFCGVRHGRARLAVSLFVVATLSISISAVMIRGDMVGSEFAVNTYTQGDQITPCAAMNTSGNSVVTWSSWSQDGSGYGVYGQMLDSTGERVGTEFLITNETEDDQKNAVVAMRSNGNFTVAWQSKRDFHPSSGTYTDGIRMRQYFANGTQVPDGLPPPYMEHLDYYDPALAVASDAYYTVVVWTSLLADGSEDVNGYVGYSEHPSPQFRANTYNDSSQAQPSVAVGSDGDFVVVWRSEGQDGDSGGIYGQLFSSDGSKSGSEFAVNTYTTGDQAWPSVSMDSNGDFVVLWSSLNQDGNGWGVYGQRFSSMGMKEGLEFQVNSLTIGNQLRPSVSMDDAGNFVVVWCTSDLDSSGFAILGKRYYGDGTPLGTEFQVNTYEAGDQFYPCVSCNGMGDFIAVWESDGQDGSGSGIFGQLYNKEPIPEFSTLLVPVALAMMTMVALRRRGKAVS